MNRIIITQNNCGAWLIYANGVLVFSCLAKTRAIKEARAFKSRNLMGARCAR